MTKLTIILLAAFTALAGDWSDAVEVQHDARRCVAYRARLSGQFLMVEATLEPGWHTFAMDNKQRAEEKLAGKKSLGIDHPTEIALTGGMEVEGPWYQTPPQDFSRPELRWFSWGFERQAQFAVKIRLSGTEVVRVAVRGQACTDTICKNIDVIISLPPAKTPTGDVSEINLNNLIKVR